MTDGYKRNELKDNGCLRDKSRSNQPDKEELGCKSHVGENSPKRSSASDDGHSLKWEDFFGEILFKSSLLYHKILEIRLCSV